MIRLWPFASNILRVKMWLMERKMVFNRAWNKEARQTKPWKGGK
jgi:hypothetical protein